MLAAFVSSDMVKKRRVNRLHQLQEASTDRRASLNRINVKSNAKILIK
jgi:hypothetical protein